MLKSNYNQSTQMTLTGVIPCQLMQAIAPSFLDFAITWLFGRTSWADHEKPNFLKSDKYWWSYDYSKLAIFVVV